MIFQALRAIAGIFPPRRASCWMLKGRDMAESAGPLDVGRLVVDHHQALYRYAYRLSGSAADAEDLTQQVFLTAQQKIDQVRATGSWNR